MRELSDHQIKLLKICDAVRWNQVQYLHLYHYHLIRRAVGQLDPIVHFELTMATDFALAWNNDPPPPPEEPFHRSPWLELYGVEPWRADAIELEAVDMDELAKTLAVGGGPMDDFIDEDPDGRTSDG